MSYKGKGRPDIMKGTDEHCVWFVGVDSCYGASVGIYRGKHGVGVCVYKEFCFGVPMWSRSLDMYKEE